MRIEKLEEKITIPEGVSGTYDRASHTLLLKGEKGELTRLFFNPNISINIVDGAVTLIAKNATLREKKILLAFKAHIKNMLKGIVEGFTYKLKICSGHFPMSVGLKNNVLEVKNFIGEKVPRTLKIKEGTTTKIEGEFITITGIDKEIVGQVAGDIEQLTRRPGFDSRIFQDGIFITEKDGKMMGGA